MKPTYRLTRVRIGCVTASRSSARLLSRWSQLAPPPMSRARSQPRRAIVIMATPSNSRSQSRLATPRQLSARRLEPTRAVICSLMGPLTPTPQRKSQTASTTNTRTEASSNSRCTHTCSSRRRVTNRPPPCTRIQARSTASSRRPMRT